MAEEEVNPEDLEIADELIAERRAESSGGVLEILCQFFNVQHNAVRRIDNDRQIRF